MLACPNIDSFYVVFYMRLVINNLLLLLLSFASVAQPLSYYFEGNVKFDLSIPTPKEVLGYELGNGMYVMISSFAIWKCWLKKSDRINFEVIGRTHEHRPLVMLTITAADKLAKVEQTRQAHLARLTGKQVSKVDQPAVVWMGYSVHGNESSGSNTAFTCLLIT
eukprot:TRINITY_DN13924_c0_g1_i1.p1 TRINITY_DN13924_c0_g1~~TRINITY_DN13924_c0_g1_i1.p1  ORF type:complete len:164 (-),score=10.65 TRINITY_DN13924_c0_g1_i1:30-521(-)